MTVHTRDGRIIVDTIWPDGKRTRRSAINEAQAKKLDTRIRSSRIDGTWRELRRKLDMESVDPMRLDEAAEIYLEQYVKTKNRDRKSKKSRLKIIGAVTGNPLLAEIDLQTVTRYTARRMKAGVSAKTVNRDVAVLRHLMVWSVKNGLVESNPIENWEKLSESPFQGRRPEEALIDAVFKHIEPTAKPLYEFLRETGCRREEALSLRWPQVDLAHRVVMLFKTKSGKARPVPLTDEAIAAIRSMPRSSETQYVFYHPVSMTRWNEAKDPWNRAREAAGVPWLRIHDLRHAYAIKLAEAAVPMEVISEMLGHHSVDFTKKIYAKYAPSWAGRVVLAALEGGKSKSGKKVATLRKKISG